jgi:hypothetical protein
VRVSSTYDEVDLLIDRDLGIGSAAAAGLRARKAGGYTIKKKYHREREKDTIQKLIKLDMEDKEGVI